MQVGEHRNIERERQRILDAIVLIGGRDREPVETGLGRRGMHQRQADLEHLGAVERERGLRE